MLRKCALRVQEHEQRRSECCSEHARCCTRTDTDATSDSATKTTGCCSTGSSAAEQRTDAGNAPQHAQESCIACALLQVLCIVTKTTGYSTAATKTAHLLQLFHGLWSEDADRDCCADDLPGCTTRACQR